MWCLEITLRIMTKIEFMTLIVFLINHRGLILMQFLSVFFFSLFHSILNCRTTVHWLYAAQTGSLILVFKIEHNWCFLKMFCWHYWLTDFKAWQYRWIGNKIFSSNINLKLAVWTYYENYKKLPQSWLVTWSTEWPEPGQESSYSHLGFTYITFVNRA